MPEPNPTGPVTVADYARLRGVSHTAVQQRIRAGVLPTTAKQIKGRWMILDVDQANAEWDAHTRPRVSAHGDGSRPSALAEATLRERRARAWAIELDIARKTRTLLPAAEVEQAWADEVMAVKTRLLSWQTILADRLHRAAVLDGVTGVDRVLKDAVRELLLELAAGRTAETKSEGDA